MPRESIAQLIKLSFPRKPALAADRWESILFENLEIIDSRFHGNDNKVILQHAREAGSEGLIASLLFFILLLHPLCHPGLDLESFFTAASLIYLVPEILDHLTCGI
ncbi:MAG: hypothetical protein M1480_11440 [Bacteroidetes bacterium]|nr:hypothetical protein [Bacteroidota bacterium]